MTANLDGTINDNGEMAIFEAKTASAFKQDIWEEGIPAPYILQIQEQKELILRQLWEAITSTAI